MLLLRHIWTFQRNGIDYDPSDWRLFIDSSVKSLKAVLLHNGNEFPSIPVGHSVHMKEEYENFKTLLDMIKYTSHNWELCGDFKMLAFLLGQQGGYTKWWPFKTDLLITDPVMNRSVTNVVCFEWSVVSGLL